MVDVSKVCGAQAKVSNVETESVLKNGNATCRNHVLHQDEVVVDEEQPTLDLLGKSSGGGLTAGSLVIHIRSGDIFNSKTIKHLKLITEFGQVCLVQRFVKHQSLWRGYNEETQGL